MCALQWGQDLRGMSPLLTTHKRKPFTNRAADSCETSTDWLIINWSIWCQYLSWLEQHGKVVTCRRANRPWVDTIMQLLPPLETTADCDDSRKKISCESQQFNVRIVPVYGLQLHSVETLVKSPLLGDMAPLNLELTTADCLDEQSVNTVPVH